MSKRAPRGRRSRAVLHLSHEWAEWSGPLRRGRVAIGRAPVLGVGIEDLADAAIQALAAAGGRGGPAVLALSGELVEQRLVKLPPLPAGDLRRVCQRKAAAMLEADPKETLFVALPMKEEDGEAQEVSAEQRWLLVAQHRARAVELRQALRRRRINVERVTVARLARLSRAQEVRGDSGKACVVIDVEQGAVDLSLIVESSLAHQTRLEGDLAANQSMTLAVVQELRGFDTFWRRTHRGGRVAQVVVIGLDPARALLLLQAVDTALPEAEITALPDVPEVGTIDTEEAESTGRAESMRACEALGPFTADLTVHVPAPHTFVLSLAAGMLVVGVGLGTLLYQRLTLELGKLEDRARAMTFQARDLEEVAGENERARAAVFTVESELERLVSAARLGLPLEETLRDALSAFGPGTALLSLTIDSGEAGGAVLLGGVTDPDPVSAMLRLDAVGAALEAHPDYWQVEVDPPVPMGPGSELLAFAVRARRGAPEVVQALEERGP